MKESLANSYKVPNEKKKKMKWVTLVGIILVGIIFSAFFSYILFFKARAYNKELHHKIVILSLNVPIPDKVKKN